MTAVACLVLLGPLGGGCSRAVRGEAIAPDRSLTWPALAAGQGKDAGDTAMGLPGHEMSTAEDGSDGSDGSDGGDDDTADSSAIAPPTPSVGVPVDAAAMDADAVEVAIDTRLPPPVVPLAPSDLTRGRVGHWRFDETRGNAAADSSAIGNHGGTVGILNEDWQPARFGNGLTFTPARRSFVSVGAHDTLSPARTLTLALWAKPQAWNVNGRPCFVQKGGADEQYGVIVHSGQLQFFIRLTNGLIARATAAMPPSAIWAHITGVYDGQAAYLFVDGEAVARTAQPGRPLGTYQNLTIGGRPPEANEGEFFAGQLDEVLLYDRALSSAEVALLAAGRGP
jgi:hypothetical protein